MKLFSCKHPKLQRVRAHQESETGLQYRQKAICIDKHQCLIFIKCLKCKKFLDIDFDDAAFGELKK